MIALLVFTVVVLGLPSVQPQDPTSGMVRVLTAIRESIACDTTGAAALVDDLMPALQNLDQSLAQPRVGDPLEVDIVLLQSRDASDLVDRIDQNSLSEIDSVKTLVARRSYTTALTTSIDVLSVNTPWTILYDTDLDRLNYAAQELGLGCISFAGSYSLLYLVRRARAAVTVLLLEKLHYQKQRGLILYAIDPSKFPDLGTVLTSRGHVVHYYRFVP